jgi:hypothetical protein
VAALFDTENLAKWVEKSYTQTYVKKAMESIYDVVVRFEASENSSINQLTSPESTDSIVSLVQNEEELIHLVKNSTLENASHTKRISLDEAVKKEAREFLQMINNEDLTKQSTIDFWNDDKRKKLVNLRKLVLKLNAIPASVAFIESFFSICGCVTDKKSSALSANAIIAKTMLKINMPIIENLEIMT